MQRPEIQSLVPQTQILNRPEYLLSDSLRKMFIESCPSLNEFSDAYLLFSGEYHLE